jgi:hypothetical protein
MKLSAALIVLLLLFPSLASAQVVDPFDQLAQAYYTALRGRLDRSEISKGEFDTLRVRMMEGIIKAKQERVKLAVELQKLQLEQQRLANQQQAIQAVRGGAQAQGQPAITQQQAVQARYWAAAQQRAIQQYWANWAQHYQQGMQNPINCTGMNFSGGTFTVNCN